MAVSPINQPLASDLANMTKVSYRWLFGKIASLQKNQKFPGAFNPPGYQNPKYFSLGEVFMYHYDPKWKDKLPYYDTFPLVIPINTYNDGFLGLNMHYLPPSMRVAFLNKLVAYANAAPGDNRYRMNINYEMLKSSTNLNYHIPCLKRYLITHVRGRMLRIRYDEWPLIVTMPFDAFQKQSNVHVWTESRKKINGTI